MANWDDVRRIALGLPHTTEAVSGVTELEDLIVDAWLARAPKRLAKEFLASR